MKNVLPFSYELTTGWKALSTIRHQLGIAQTAAVLSSMIGAMREGEPFGSLPKPAHRREELSRKQVAPSILLHRALLERMPAQEALQIVRRVTVHGARAFLQRLIKSFDGLRQDASDQQFVTDVDQTFFHAELTWGEISQNTVTFNATDCQYPALCKKANAMELAPLFCEGDRSFFGQDLEGVKLILPHTIAQGASFCPFRLELNGKK